MKEETARELQEDIKLLRLLLENYLSEENFEAYDGYLTDRKALNVEEADQDG